MARIFIVYGTWDGHTSRLAEHIREQLALAGHEVEAHNAASLPADFSPERFDAAIVGSAVHAGKHKREVTTFARRHRDWLAAHPSAFFSSGTEIITPGEAEKARAPVKRLVRETGWEPKRTELVAGALLYSRHNVLTRWVWRFFMRRAGLATQDHDYTDYEQLSRFAAEFGAELAAPASAQPAARA